jgi:GPH family glycoside/pentoside/hexuronide:cation symporter
MGVSNMILAVLGVVVFNRLARRVGKRSAIMTALVFSIAMYASTWWLYNPAFPWAMAVVWGLVGGAGATGIWMLFGSMQADVMDYDELHTGMRREGAFSACSSWLIKAGMALGAGGANILLPLTGFSAALGPAQSEHTLTAIRLLFPLVPIAGLGLAILCIRRFDLTQASMHEIRGQLEARRGEV